LNFKGAVMDWTRYTKDSIRRYVHSSESAKSRYDVDAAMSHYLIRLKKQGKLGKKPVLILPSNSGKNGFFDIVAAEDFKFDSEYEELFKTLSSKEVDTIVENSYYRIESDTKAFGIILIIYYFYKDKNAVIDSPLVTNLLNDAKNINIIKNILEGGCFCFSLDKTRFRFNGDNVNHHVTAPIGFMGFTAYTGKVDGSSKYRLSGIFNKKRAEDRLYAMVEFWKNNKHIKVANPIFRRFLDDPQLFFEIKEIEQKGEQNEKKGNGRGNRKS